MKRVGIFGGSFDPVHNGHVSLALDAVSQANLDILYFVPAKLQPFKLDKKAVEGFHRVNMIEKSIENHEKLEVSTYELDKNEISYTVNTLNYFSHISGKDAKIYFLTGTDSFLEIHTWKRAEEFLLKYNFIVGVRPGYMEDEIYIQKSNLEEKFGCEIYILENTRIDVSSSEIRKRISEDRSLKDLVPEKVERYISENGLYR